MLFKNWKLLFKNICENTCGWKSVLKYMKCCLKTENGCLKTQTKYPLNLPTFEFSFFYIYKRLYILLNIYDTKYAKTTGPCRPWLAQECRCTMPKRFSPELKIKKKKKNHASSTFLYFEYELSSLQKKKKKTSWVRYHRQV